MGKSEKRSLEIYLERLIEHILKLQYWRATPRRREAQGNARDEAEYDRNHRHWQAEATNFRNQIARLLKRSPSLKNYMSEVYLELYENAIESRSKIFDIPEHKPFPLEKILDQNFFA